MELRKNEITLTGRESEILKLAAEGKSNCEIGDCLYISVHTVKAHMIELYRKFKVHNRIQLIIRAIRLGFISVE